MFLFNPVNSLSRSTPLFTPLKLGEVKWNVSGHRKVKLVSIPKPFYPKPLPAAGERTSLRAGPLSALHSIHLYWGQNLKITCQPRFTGGKTNDSDSEIHCISIATFLHEIIVSVRTRFCYTPKSLECRLLHFHFPLSFFIGNSYQSIFISKAKVSTEQHRK